MFTKKFHTFLYPQAISFWTSVRTQRNFLLAASYQITSLALKPSLELQCRRYFCDTITQNNKANISNIKTEKHKEKVQLKDGPTPEGSKVISKPLGKPKISQLYKKGSHYAKVYGLVLRRVVQTCKIYVNLSPAEQKKIAAKSRVSYIKKRLDLLSPERFQSFKEYLNHIDEFGYNVELSRVYKSSTAEESNNPIYEGLLPTYMQKKKVANENTVMRISKSKAILFNRKHVSQCLRVEDNGPLMLELILDFLTKRNIDFKLYLADDIDEKEIGRVARIQRQPKTKTKTMLIKHLDKVRLVFQSLARE